jgi:serine/threonine protein kinase
MAEGQKKKIFDGRYDILSIVGRGACSVVYHARHISPPITDVALKVLINKQGKRANSDRLRKEALAMVSSRHRYVIRLDDFHSVGDLCYLSMEFAPESDVRKFAARSGGRLGVVQAERFLLQAAEALGFIHRAGIIHRDLKPDNILVMNQNEIRLGDFGVAVLPGEESSLEELQQGIGTMDYMAPEVLEGVRYDQRSDVYALAVTFYEILSGKHPFAGLPIAEQLTARKDGAVPPLSALAPEVPGYLSTVIMKAMSYSEEQRYPTGRDMLQALLVAKSEAPAPTTVSAPKSSAPQRTKGAAAEQSAQPKPAKRAADAVASYNPKQNAAETPVKQVANSGAAAKGATEGRQRKPTLTPLTPGKVVAGKPISKPKDAANAAPKGSEAPAAAGSKPALSRTNDAESSQSERTQSERTQSERTQSERTKARAGEQVPEQSENTAPQEEESPIQPTSQLPGIGLKRTSTSPTIPTKSAGGVTVKEPPRRQTVVVSAAEMLAVKQGAVPAAVPEQDTARPTVTLAAEPATKPSSLAASAMQEPAEDDDEMSERFAAVSPLNAEPKKLSPNALPHARKDTIKGFHGKLKKVSNSSDSSEGRSSTKSQLAAISSRPELRKRVALAALAVGMLLAISSTQFGSMGRSGGSKRPDATTAQQVGEVFSNSADVQGLPAVTAEQISFPHLPEGLYTGTISGLTTAGKDVPLSFISIPVTGQLAVIVGIPGWTGTVADLPSPPKEADAPTPPLRVSSNGWILEMTGQVVEGALTGFYRNLVTGEEGQWSASPVRGER